MSILNHFFDYKPEVLALDEKAMELCQPYFRQMEEIRDFNQLKMLKAFADTQMSSTDMLGTTGYGLWDTGRATLEQIFAEVMGAEDALVRSQFQSGTHTLAVALFGLLLAGDTLLAATGRPYDTLEGVIGLDGKGKGTGTLMDYGIRYDEAPLKADFTPDYDLIAKKAPGAKVCHIQRSRGYIQRTAFDLATIRKIADTARAGMLRRRRRRFRRGFSDDDGDVFPVEGELSGDGLLDLAFDLQGEGVARLFEPERDGHAAFAGVDMLLHAALDDVPPAFGVDDACEQRFDFLLHNVSGI